MPRINKRDADAKLKELLRTMDKDIANTFTYKQRKALMKSLSDRDWRKHQIDLRPTIAFPLLPWSIYFVFLAGTNRRELSKSERFIAFLMFFSVIFCLGLIVIGVALLVVYLFKSWLGIDLFPNDSLGIWDQFKNAFSVVKQR